MENMDEASQAEIFKILLHDMEDIFDANIDTQVHSDLRLALSLWRQEIDNFATVTEDRRVAERVASVARRGRGSRVAVNDRDDKRAIASWRHMAAGQEIDLLGNYRCVSYELAITIY